jgi:hypothetical protein
MESWPWEPAIVWGDLGWLGTVKDYQIQIMPYAFRSQAHLDKFMDSPLAMELEKHSKPRATCSSASTPTNSEGHRQEADQQPGRLERIKMRFPEWPIAMKSWTALGTTTIVPGRNLSALAQGGHALNAASSSFIRPSSMKWRSSSPAPITPTAVAGPSSVFLLLPADPAGAERSLLCGREALQHAGGAAKVEHTQRYSHGATIIDVDTAPFKAK